MVSEDGIVDADTFICFCVRSRGAMELPNEAEALHIDDSTTVLALAPPDVL